jgi:hypothetical protein
MGAPSWIGGEIADLGRHLSIVGPGLCRQRLDNQNALPIIVAGPGYGIINLCSLEESGFLEPYILKIWGKLTFRPNLRYHALDEKNWLPEEDRLKRLNLVREVLKTNS